jgi:hypothetical protein
VHGRTASAAFDANDPKETLDVQCNQLSGCTTASIQPLSRKRRFQVEERGRLIAYGMEAFLFGTSELLLGVNDLVDAFANSAGE